MIFRTMAGDRTGLTVLGIVPLVQTLCTKISTSVANCSPRRVAGQPPKTAFGDSIGFEYHRVRPQCSAGEGTIV